MVRKSFIKLGKFEDLVKSKQSGFSHLTILDASYSVQISHDMLMKLLNVISWELDVGPYLFFASRC